MRAASALFNSGNIKIRTEKMRIGQNYTVFHFSSLPEAIKMSDFTAATVSTVGYKTTNSLTNNLKKMKTFSIKKLKSFSKKN
jgi:hypothetical protein